MGESLSVSYYTLQKRKNSVAYTNKYYRTNCWKKKATKEKKKGCANPQNLYTLYAQGIYLLVNCNKKEQVKRKYGM